MDASALPVGFWTDLVRAVGGELTPGLRSFLPTQVQPDLRGDTLILRVASSFGRKMVDTPETLQRIRAEAGRMLGRPVAVQVAVGSQEQEDRFGQLLAFGRAHEEIFDIK